VEDQSPVAQPVLLKRYLLLHFQIRLSVFLQKWQTIMWSVYLNCTKKVRVWLIKASVITCYNTYKAMFSFIIREYKGAQAALDAYAVYTSNIRAGPRI